LADDHHLGTLRQRGLDGRLAQMVELLGV
jgi:hypothetical protein